MIQRDRGDRAGGGPINDIGRITAATKTNLQHAQIRWCLGEQMERSGASKTVMGAPALTCSTASCPGERLVRHEASRDADALVEAHQVG